MNNLAENNLVRFIAISRKKEGFFAKFKVKGIRGGIEYSSTITVALDAADLDIAEDSLETIIEGCAKVAVREFKKTDLQFEGMTSL